MGNKTFKGGSISIQLENFGDWMKPG